MEVDLSLFVRPLSARNSFSNGNDPKFPKLENGDRDILHDWTMDKTWAGMEKVLASGKAKAIGVSK